MVVGRFAVMATIQAARAFELGLPRESAYSWGLNRAIFYAAAKRGFKGGGSAQGHSTGRRRTSKGSGMFELGDESAFKEEREGVLYFTIGGEIQTGKEFEKQVKVRFKGKFDKAWDEALDYVRQFDRETLLSGGEFFAAVYKPKRDEFASSWTWLAELQGQTKPAR